MWHPPWGTCVTCKWDRLCQQQTARRCPPPQSITTKTEVIFTSITCHRHSAGEKMCNHPFSITLQKNHKPFSLSFFFFLWIKKKQAQIQISNIGPVISLPQVYWRKTHPRGHWVLINSDVGTWSVRVSIGCEVQRCHSDLDSVSPRSFSHLEKSLGN